MSKYIYTWHPEVEKYSLRIATPEESLKIQIARNMIKEAKRSYNFIEREAAKSSDPFFYDNEAYTAIKDMEELLDTAKAIAKGLVEYNLSEYYLSPYI